MLLGTFMCCHGHLTCAEYCLLLFDCGVTSNVATACAIAVWVERREGAGVRIFIH